VVSAGFEKTPDTLEHGSARVEPRPVDRPGRVEEVEAFRTERVDFDLGGRRYLRTGEVLSDETLEELRGFDAILLGAVGTPDVPPGVIERGLLLRIRFAFDQYVNYRPVTLYDGVTSPVAGLTRDRCDLVIIRENTESVYAGAGGTLYRGTPNEVATQESVNTRHGVERVVRFAFEEASRRDGRLTLVHKTNVLTHAGDLWWRVVEELGEADFPHVERDYVHVDAACLYLVTQPERFDVVVTENLFGDIITDLGAAVQGGLGLAASGNLDPTRLDAFHDMTLLGIVSLMAWGLGYFGQPHIVVRFMAIKTSAEMPKARLICMAWMVLAMFGAIFTGFAGIAYYAVQPLDNPETVFINLTQVLFNPWVAGASGRRTLTTWSRRSSGRWGSSRHPTARPPR
jgi:isocitrate/isopropylmalate dehydrogenase